MSDEQPRRPLVRLKVVIPILLLGVGVCFLIVLTASVGHSSWASNERRAAFELKSLVTEEADFRGNDRDWNHVNDYWTGDVKSLYSMTSAAVPGNKRSTLDMTLQLLGLSVALADVDRSLLPAGGENTVMTDYGIWGAGGGYWYAAMTRDDLRDPTMGDPVYRQDTGGEPLMGRVHHLHRFGFVAFPATTKTGKNAFIVGPSGVVYRKSMAGRVFGDGVETPPRFDQLPAEFLNWPSEADLKKWETFP